MNESEHEPYWLTHWPAATPYGLKSSDYSLQLTRIHSLVPTSAGSIKRLLQACSPPSTPTVSPSPSKRRPRKRK